MNELAVQSGTLASRSVAYAKQLDTKRSSTGRARAKPKKGLTGAALERALDRWASLFPDRVHEA